MSLKQQLDNCKDIQPYLFDKGFIITDAEVDSCNEFPFYGNWNRTDFFDFRVLTHKRTTLYSYVSGEQVHILIGHAYNPFTGDASENDCLAHLAEYYGSPKYQDYLDELTGVYMVGVIMPGKIDCQLDASGMQYGCYGTVEGKHYIASHMQLIGDLCGLAQMDYVRRLVKYRWYHYMMGNYLPGSLTCFEEIKRIIPNTSVLLDDGHFTVSRFYPNHEIRMADSEEEYASVIQNASEILQNTMRIIPRKWARPAISLTGGIDNNTTFAAANGFYEKYSAFSYVSMYRESVDAEKAEQISNKFHVPYHKYSVPDSNNEIPDFDIFKAIFIHNDGEIGGMKDNDVRKKITLIRNDVCDVEVKSWISETIRAYAYKYFGRTKLPSKMRPRVLTSLYKIFLGNRKLACETDKYFKSYIEETKLDSHLFNYDYSDFFVWEMMHGGKCGLDIGVMKSCFDITIPYNNRKLLDMLLSVPFEKRLSD